MQDHLEFQALRPIKGFSTATINQLKTKVMKFAEVIGIDVSKSTLDVWIYTNDAYKVFDNTRKGYHSLLSWVRKNTECLLDQVLFCFEHTGIYSYALSKYMSEKQFHFAIISGLEIKRSMGIRRGKDDKIDARQIALYGYRRKAEIKCSQLPEEEITQLRQLFSLRERLVRQKAGYQATMKEQVRFLKRSDNTLLFSVPSHLIKELDKEINRIELQMETIVEESSELNRLYKLITSITGIGSQTALYLIIITNGFLLFDDPRKLASYAGVAPFPYRSGSSVRGRTRVSKMANKKLKSLLNSCARSAIQYDPELRLYYERRTKAGKDKMNTLNAVRNKLLYRVFAVVKRGTPFVNTHAYAA